MTKHFFKRTPKNVVRPSIALLGPLTDANAIPANAEPQFLKFNLANGTTARCDLQPGKTYAAAIRMYGKRGGSLKCETQPSDQSAPPNTVFTAKIPDNYNGPNGQLDYSYMTVIHFKAPGGAS